MEQSAPHYLRIKELMESIECFNLIVAHLNSAESTRGRSIDDARVYDTFFDLACGHGLVGVLLAYAFPTRTVRSFDHAKRAAFFAFCRAFEDMRKTMLKEPWNIDMIDWDTEENFVAINRLEETNDASSAPDNVRDKEEPALSNIVFTLGDIDDARALVSASSFVIALHGCNEANRVAVEMAKSKDAVWAVMPCCIKASIYLPATVVSKLDDDSKYAFMCGVMCQTYDAQMVRAIDTRITTRAIVLCGGIEGFKKHCFVIGNNTKIQRERAKVEPTPH
jgi:SAM-dependent methyltransferase